MWLQNRVCRGNSIQTEARCQGPVGPQTSATIEAAVAFSFPPSSPGKIKVEDTSFLSSFRWNKFSTYSLKLKENLKHSWYLILLSIGNVMVFRGSLKSKWGSKAHALHHDTILLSDAPSSLYPAKTHCFHLMLSSTRPRN